MINETKKVFLLLEGSPVPNVFVSEDVVVVDSGKPEYIIIDCNGHEMSPHYSGRDRTFKECLKMLYNLNKNGEYAPYTISKK